MVNFGVNYAFTDLEYPDREFDGQGFESPELSSLRTVLIEFEKNEVLAEVSSTGDKITDFVFLIGEDNYITAKIRISDSLNIAKTDDVGEK